MAVLYLGSRAVVWGARHSSAEPVSAGVSDAGGGAPVGPVVVLGAHRAGTSAVTRVLQLLGLYLGDESRLLGPVAGDNDRGFYEHRELMLISEELLRRMGGNWHEPPALGGGWELDPDLDDLRERSRQLMARDFGSSPLWGFKDPRLALTLPFWLKVAAPVGHVIVHRSPLGVARSLQRRNAIALEHGLELWTHYMAGAIFNTATARRIIVGYDELYTNHRAVVGDLAAFLGVGDPADDLQRSAEIRDAVDERLRHHAGSVAQDMSDPAMSAPVRELFGLLERAVSARRSDERRRAVGSELDSLAARLGARRPPRATAQRRRVLLGRRPLRIVAMMQVFNERRFLAGCIEHLRANGVAVYLIDNESTDDTLAIAERYLGAGVIGIETLPRSGCFSLRQQCRRQEELARTIDADWLIHHDADEIRVAPRRGQTLAEAIAECDDAGFNAVNFLEFAFVATREFPDHDHADFARTMRWYYPFAPWFPHRCNAWKRQNGPVDLVTEAGHVVGFPGLRMAPASLYMRHYLFISRRHALEKFVERRFEPDEVDDGWFGWRPSLRPEMILLPSITELRPYVADHRLDSSQPLTRHMLEDSMLHSPVTTDG